MELPLHQIRTIVYREFRDKLNATESHRKCMDVKASILFLMIHSKFDFGSVKLEISTFKNTCNFTLYVEKPYHGLLYNTIPALDSF